MGGNLEEKIREKALQMKALMEGEAPSLFEGKRWSGKAMAWAMRDETLKVALFRFIDVLPALRNDALVVRLAKEYLGGASVGPLLRTGVRGIPEKGLFPRLTGRAVRHNVEALARQFIAGTDPEDAMSPLATLWREGFATSVDLLGEAVLSEKEAREYAGRYLALLEFLHPEVSGWPENPVLDGNDRGPVPRLNLSAKVSSFYSQLDPVDWEGSVNTTKLAMRPLFRKARELGAAVTFDMEHYYLKDLTLAIFRKVLEEFEDFDFGGTVVQSYLKESKDDLLGLVKWAKKRKRAITVRLVKGAYWDYEKVVNRQKGWPVPIFLDKSETDRNFEALTRLLLENAEHARPAVATHNVRSICSAIAHAEALGLPKDALEFQVLYGMAEPVRKALGKMGYRVRVYAPAGALIPGMAYLIRRLLENTSNESFLRKSFFEDVPFEELIKPPGPGRGAAGEKPRGGFRNEPETDFSREENRRAMKDALKKVGKTLGGKYPLYIGGREVPTDNVTRSTNPARPEETVGVVASAARAEADEALREARLAWDAWRRTPPGERAAVLRRAAAVMRGKRFELSALEVYEVGKAWKEADADVAEAIDNLEYYAREAMRLGPRLLGDYPGEENEYRYEPRGVGVVISPWNFPLAIPAGMVSAAIAAGNCVIFKPSGLSPVTGWKLVEALGEAGLPPGVLNFLPGPGSGVGEYLVTHPGVDFIAFTGSKDVGLGIVERAGRTHPGQRNVKRVISEMGGKNAVIVDETADLDEAVKGVLQSALGYQGQKCSACSRAVVVGEVFNEFTERLGEAMSSIRMGPPEEPGNLMGPVVDEAALKKIKGYIEVGKKEGRAVFIREAGEAEGGGYYVRPAIFTDVNPVSSLAQEEIFGPVLVVLRARDIDEALEIANSTPYALTGGIFSRSPANIRKAREEFGVGNLYINRGITGALVGRQPFGGTGMSGVGSKAGGPDYLLQFMTPKSISENTLRRGFAPEL